MVICSLVPMSRISSHQNAEVKMGSRLEISDWGTLWSRTMSVKNAYATDSRLHRVWMSERDEVAVLTETIDHRQDDRFAPNARQCLHEIQAEIIPDSRRNWQRQQESGWMKMLGTCSAGTSHRRGCSPGRCVAGWAHGNPNESGAMCAALLHGRPDSGHELGQQREL